MPRSFYLFQATGKFTDLGRPTSAVLHQVGFCTLPGFSCLVTICLVEVQETAWWLSPTLMVNILLMISIWLTIITCSGWWLSHQPPWKMMEFSESQLGYVGMIFSIPNWMESHKIPWFQSPPTTLEYVKNPTSFTPVWSRVSSIKNKSQKHQKEAEFCCVKSLMW